MKNGRAIIWLGLLLLVAAALFMSPTRSLLISIFNALSFAGGGSSLYDEGFTLGSGVDITLRVEIPRTGDPFFLRVAYHDTWLTKPTDTIPITITAHGRDSKRAYTWLLSDKAVRGEGLTENDVAFTRSSSSTKSERIEEWWVKLPAGESLDVQMKVHPEGSEPPDKIRISVRRDATYL